MSERNNIEVSAIAKGAAAGRTILAYLASPVAVISRHLKFAYTNPAFEEAFDVVLKDILGRELDDILDTTAARRLSRDLKEVLEKSLNKETEFTADNRLYIATISAIRESNSELPTGAVVTFHDVTVERKLAEARARFTAVVLEDLKEPASIANSHLKELKKLPEVSAKMNELINKVEENVGKVIDVIDEYFQLGSSVDGEIVLEKDTLSISQLLNDVNSALKKTAREKDVIFDTIGTGSFNIKADEAKLSAALINLSLSLIRATSGRGVVTMIAEPAPAEGFDARFIITSGGKDISEDDFRELSKGGLSPDQSSPDMGLVASARIIEAHDGTIIPVGVKGAGLSLVINI